jgi:ATP-dependent helicase/nuclease subunit A
MPERKKRKAVAPSEPRRPAMADEAARERIQTDLDTTFLVEAGAGSGKTKSLVDRMVALIAGGRATIQTMAAVTFTRKAAAELRGRFQLALERSLRPGGARDAESEDRLRAALRDLEQGFIGTIHSFCARLLRERPVECGVDPEFEELDDIENALIREECWHDYLVLARLEADEVLRDLDDVGLSPDELKDAFDTLSDYPEVVPAAGRAEAPDFGDIRAELEAFLDTATAAVPERRPDAGWDSLQSLARRLEGRRGRLGFTDHRLLMESIELLDKNPRATRKCWPSKEAAEAFEASFQAFRESVVFPALRVWREHRHAKAMAFLGPALKFFEVSRRGRSRLNFQDQLLLAAELLRENPEVRRYFQDRYRRVLVDEFQDTDPIQAEVLFYLTGTDVGENDWTKLAPRAGSLFLVGDPKQSIYRFRRADVDIYNLVKNAIRRGGGEVLNLTANFRSLAGLSAWANSIFQTALPAAPTAFQAAYAPLETVRPGCEGGACGVFKATVPKVERNKGEDIALLDAGRIAAFVAGACEGGLWIGAGPSGARPARPEDFLILFRYKKFMDVYARALEARGVPYEVTGSNAFSGSEEIEALVNLLQALKDADNRVAVVAVLKGIFFGASDQDLLDFRSAGGELAITGKEATAGAAGDRVGRALRTLREWREWTTKYPPSIVLEIILERSGLLNYLVTSEMGSSRAGIVLKLVEVVRSLEISGAASFAAVADFLAGGAGLEAVEEMSLTPGRPDAVRLMNLHKAKGLEAPVVILANPLGQKEHEPDKHILRTRGHDGESGPSVPGGLPAPLGFFQLRKRGQWTSRLLAEPAGWEKMAEREAEYAAAEEDRLMYVAATRAGDVLIVSTYEADLGGKESWGILDGGLDNVAELSEGALPGRKERSGPVRPRPPAKLAVRPLDHQKGRQEIQVQRGKASVARYRVETVTSLAKADRPFPERESGGQGMAWGSAVHILLNAAGRCRLVAGQDETGKPVAGEPFRLAARNALVASGLGVEEEGRLVDLVLSIIGSEFWARARKAETRLFEVPFSVKVGPDDPDYRRLTDRPGFVPTAGERPVATAPDAPVFLTGAIDLAFLEEDGWVIADYKTDRLAETAAEKGIDGARSAFDELKDYYRPQVALYRRFWEKITGQRVKESGLYFTSLGTWVKLD